MDSICGEMNGERGEKGSNFFPSPFFASNFLAGRDPTLRSLLSLSREK